VPLYAFACPDCGARFEELQAFDDPAPSCPACAGTGAERVLSAFQAGPARKGPDTFTPAQTRRDLIHHHHH
jgi:putative FmdB family regulatory protein